MRQIIVEQVYPNVLSKILDSEHPERWVHTVVLNLSTARLTLIYGDGVAVIVDIAYFGQSDFRSIGIQDDGAIISFGKDLYAVEWFQTFKDPRIQVKK